MTNVRLVSEDATEASFRQQATLDPGGQGPPDPGIEVRLAAVEIGVKHLDGKVGSLESKIESLDTRLRGVENKLYEMSGKLDLLVGKIPSWWQPTLTASGMLALLLAAIEALKYFGFPA